MTRSKPITTRPRHRPIWTVVLLCFVVITGCAGSRERQARQLWQSSPVRVDRPNVPSLGVNPSLDDYLALAVRNSPRLEAARQEWRAALEQASIAGSLPDPVLSYGYFIEEVETRVGPQKQRLGINQQIPWFGTLGNRKDAALSAAEAAYHRYQETLSRLTRDVTIAYADYYLLAATLEVTRGNLQLLRSWEAVLDARYATAEADYSDLIQIQVEIGRLEDRVATLVDRQGSQVNLLNSRIGLPADTPLPWPSQLPEGEPLPGEDEIENAAFENNPELLALRSLVDGEETRIDLARRSGYPDFAVGLDWIQTDPRNVEGLDEDGKDPVVAMLSVRLPLWRGKVRAGIDRAEALRDGAAERLKDREQTLSSELADLLFRYKDAERRLTLYRDSLLPKGNQSLEAASTSFRAGKASFLKILDAQRVLLEFQLSLENARADRLKARAGIDARLGTKRSEG